MSPHVFANFINEAVDDGFGRGINLFMESLEEDLTKSEVINEYGLPKILNVMCENAGIDPSGLDMSEIDENTLDQVLSKMAAEI